MRLSYYSLGECDWRLVLSDSLMFLPLYPYSETKMKRYTKKHHRFFKLDRAKNELLNPLLRTMVF